jgi:monofunctional biosynthetic peptidoglycan transglycosylase
MNLNLTQLKKKLEVRFRKQIDKATYILLSPYRILKIICFWVGFTTIMILLGLTTYIHGIYQSIPDLTKITFPQLKEMAQESVQRKLENPRGREMANWTELNDVHRDFVYSIVMSEDSTFFEHDGFDYDAIMTSLIEDLSKKKFEYGASTISQQVVKNLFLTNEKALVRKLKEVIITQKLERTFKKNQILEVYLNIAEFGPDLFGVREASDRIFAKSPSEINAAEGAFMALMLPSPRKNYYAMVQNQNLAPPKRRKIRRILGDMLVSEFISPKQYKTYTNYDYFTHPRNRSIAGHRSKTHK